MTRSRRGAAFVTAALLFAVSASGAPALSQQGDAQFTYAAGDAQGPGIFDRKYPAPLQTPAGTVAAASWVEVVPSGSTFTIYIDDYALPDGQEIYVHVVERDGWAGCVPVRSEETIPGLKPGETAELSVGMPDGQVSCGMPVTAGVVTIRGAVLAT